MSRKLELLELMNIDTSWMKDHNHNIDNSPSLDDLKLRLVTVESVNYLKKGRKLYSEAGAMMQACFLLERHQEERRT